MEQGVRASTGPAPFLEWERSTFWHVGTLVGTAIGEGAVFFFFFYFSTVIGFFFKFVVNSLNFFQPSKVHKMLIDCCQRIDFKKWRLKMSDNDK